MGLLSASSVRNFITSSRFVLMEHFFELEFRFCCENCSKRFPTHKKSVS
ncbi:unnamed protein product, partial [Amoebophrya sp. A120]|eukprot:GSA120T00024194001.1